MAFTNTSKIANRYGLEFKIYALSDTTMTTALMTIDFANSVSVDLSGDRVWATGGQSHTNQICFNNPISGTLTMSTQVMCAELINLMAGGTAGSAASTIDFSNATANSTPSYYIIKGTTVWQEDNGTTYTQTLTFHKVCPQRAFNITYSGDGDPTSVDIVFDLMDGAQGKVMSVSHA